MISDEPLGLAPSGDTPSEAAPSRADDGEARFRRMVEEHLDDLWRFMRRLGVAEPDLDDAFQEVAMIAIDRVADIAQGSERAFLFSTAFRVAGEYRRRREGRREVGDEPLASEEDPVPEPDALADQARARAMLDRVLAEMPTDLRAVFMLYEIEEMTMAEIAELLRLPPGTVASRLRRAREHFAGQVERLRGKMRAGAPASGAARDQDGDPER